MIGLSGVLLDSDLDHEQRAWVKTIVSSGRSLLGLIDDILDFSRIESGAMPIASAPFDVGECVESALAVVAPAAHERGLPIDSRIDPSVPAVVRGDAIRLRQVLVNLLSNAVKFTEIGGVSLTVQARGPEAAPSSSASAAVGPPAPPDALTLWVTVRDTGIGISIDAQEEILRSFVQVEGSAARRHGGTGLGLAISRRLCELMGAACGSRARGVGSTFHFTVAVQTAADEMYAAAVRDELLAGRRLLVLDGDATSREVLVEWARQWGMTPAATGCPEEARRWIRKGHRTTSPSSTSRRRREAPGCSRRPRRPPARPSSPSLLRASTPVRGPTSSLAG